MTDPPIETRAERRRWDRALKGFAPLTFPGAPRRVLRPGRWSPPDRHGRSRRSLRARNTISLTQTKLSGVDFSQGTSKTTTFDSSLTDSCVVIAYLIARNGFTGGGTSCQNGDTDSYTLIGEYTGNSLGDICAFYRVSGSAESNAITISGFNFGRSAMALLEYAGVDNTTPIYVAGVQTGAGSTTAVTVSSLTPNASNSMGVVLIGGANDITTSESAWTNSFTEQGIQAPNSSQTNQAWLVFADRLISSAQSTTWSITTATTSTQYVAFCLNPAGAAANPKGPLGMPFHGPFAGPVGP